MPHKTRRKKEMIIVDEREPIGELPPPFPPRNVVVKDDDDVRKFYDLKQEIGRGRFGTVYMVTDKETSQKFAAKFVNTKRNQDRANVEREIEIMKVLNAERPHPRLIQLYDAFDMDKEMCLVLEIVDGGELFERVIDDDFVLTEKACTIFVRQICEGVEFIHSKNILHLDMKPENILCLSREGNRIKICDFGLARKYDPRKKLQVLFGTPEFVAPEVVNFEPISFGTDMWSVGVITYVLLSGLSPFMGHNYVETMTNVTKNKYDFDDEAFKSVSDDAKDFIQKLLVLDKSLRLTPAQCQRHSWLRQPPTSTLRRSMQLANSESEDESEEDSEVEDMSIEEKIMREELENEKDMKKQEEAEALERQRLVEAKRREEALALQRQAEANKREEELEKQRQAEANKKEEVLQKQKQAEALQREEELEVTKKQLKEFVERWNSHPNSPYLIGTPISWDLQRAIQKGGWDSRASFSSVIVAPPSDPEDLSDLEDDIDIVDQDEFVHYTIEPQKPLTKQLSPEEVARELEERLTILQKQDIEKNNREYGERSEEIKYSEGEAQPKQILNEEPKCLGNETKKTTGINKTNDPNKKLPESKRKTIEASKETKESRLEKHKKAYEERKKKLKSLEEEKKREASRYKDQQKSAEKHNQSELKKSNSYVMDHTRPPEGRSSQESLSRTPTPSKSRDHLRYDDGMSATETLKKINEKPMSDYKKEYEEYLKMVSESQKKLEEPQVKEEEKKSGPSPKVNNNRKISTTKAPSIHTNIVDKSTESKKIAETNKKNENERKASGAPKKSFFQRLRQGKDNSNNKKDKVKLNENEVENESTKIPETSIEDHKKLYQEYLKMMETQESPGTDAKPMKEIEKKTLENDKRPLDHRLANGKEAKLVESSRELQRKVSDAYKAEALRKSSTVKNIDNLPKEPLKRPEIIAIQNEELGGNVPRQRKKSIPPRFEIGGECLVIDRGSRGSTPGSPVRDGGHSPRGDGSEHNSRGPTPTKQLKKQPSRDVPQQAKDVAVSYIAVDSGEVFGFDHRPSRELTPEASPSLSRKPSHEERSPSRGTREGTPVNRRPSRDVPLTPAQLERLSGASALANPDQSLEPQAWPDLIVVPQGDDAEECSDYKDSLDVPVATLVKSPSGTLLSIPGLKVSQHDKDGTITPENKYEADAAYVSNNKLVAWILDIGSAQNHKTVTNTTHDRVSLWESRDGNSGSTVRSRDPSPRRPRSKSPNPPERQNKPTPILYPLSREPSSMSLKSSDSFDNLYIQTPWGTMKRSPSRTNLSNSPSFEVTRDLQRRTTEDLSQYSQSDDHMSVDSSTRSPSPKIGHPRLYKQDSLEICDREFESVSRLSGELPPRPPDKNKLQKCNRENNLNNYDTPRQTNSKCQTLPRNLRLSKQMSVDSVPKSSTSDKKLDNKRPPSGDSKKANDTTINDNLKRKSKFPPSPNQKKKFGPLLLFSAQDRISQFEQAPSSNRAPQRAISRTKSNMVFSKTSEKFQPPSSLMEDRLLCNENKNSKSSLISTCGPPPPGPRRSPTFI